MTEGLEIKTKPSYKLDVEDFHSFPIGSHNYYERNKYLPEKSKEYEKERIRVFGLLAFNAAMLCGIFYLDSYLVSLIR